MLRFRQPERGAQGEVRLARALLSGSVELRRTPLSYPKALAMGARDIAILLLISLLLLGGFYLWLWRLDLL